jgi:L-histidine N-alpha-methyltransferase
METVGPPGALAEAVRSGLTAEQKRLPAWMFYDDAGTALFEQITRLPEYYLTRAELALFEAHAGEIARRAGPVSAVVELGVGSATKTQVLLAAILRHSPGAVFVPVDVSPAALALAEETLRPRFPSLRIAPVQGEFHAALERVRASPGPKLVLFIGSSVGNYRPEESVELLGAWRRAMSPGDGLLLGTDLRKDGAVLVPAYDDAQGVTARFNKNLLQRLNRELGGRFELDAFRHRAVWNERDSRMEMHLESVRDQVVRVEALGLEVSFRAGERIHTENSYKYTQEMVDGILRRSGFSLETTWTDPQGLFAEHLARA